LKAIPATANWCKYFGGIVSFEFFYKLLFPKLFIVQLLVSMVFNASECYID